MSVNTVIPRKGKTHIVLDLEDWKAAGEFTKSEHGDMADPKPPGETDNGDLTAIMAHSRGAVC